MQPDSQALVYRDLNTSWAQILTVFPLGVPPEGQDDACSLEGITSRIGSELEELSPVQYVDTPYGFSLWEGYVSADDELIGKFRDLTPEESERLRTYLAEGVFWTATKEQLAWFRRRQARQAAEESTTTDNELSNKIEEIYNTAKEIAGQPAPSQEDDVNMAMYMSSLITKMGKLCAELQELEESYG